MVKKIISIMICCLTVLQCFCLNITVVEAYGTDAVNSSKKKPTTGKLYDVNYYENNERYLKDITVSYDKKKKVFNDGIFYHVYDKTGNEIDLGLPTTKYPYYGFRSDWYTMEVKRDSSGIPKTATVKGQSADLNITFTYDKKGAISELSFSGIIYNEKFKAKTVFVYDSNGLIIKANKELDYDSNTTWTCEDNYEYSSSELRRINTVFGMGEKG